MTFMDQDFLLSGETARYLYHRHAQNMPIIDYHCHIDPREIYEDRPFEDLSQVWLGGDHYKWRAMRADGVAEKYITGDAAPYEKFEKWAETLPRLIGNPLYHWTHLELQRYFGISEPLGPGSCREIWERANGQLRSLSPRKVLARSRVRVLCTTDDPADDLRWHALLREESGLDCRVLPAFRPDRALHIEKPGFAGYIRLLGRAAGIEIRDMDTLKEALDRRLDFFVSMGCRAADHGMDRIPLPGGDAKAALQKALRAEALAPGEAEGYRAELLVHLAGAYAERGIVMQLHYGVQRNLSPRAFAALGPDTGFDAIAGGADSGLRLAGLLGAVEEAGQVPKTIVYSLNPADNAQIASVLGCFQNAERPGKMQHGSAWWFNDSLSGMREQLVNLAVHSALGRFIGMLTDSRSFLSYTRHEYFRRLLCDLLGGWADRGEYPSDPDALGRMVEDICYNNVNAYFGFGAEAGR